MMTNTRVRPDWNRLFETAASQSGYFTTPQAADAGFSTHLLYKHIRAGRITRAQRAIYRLVHFPADAHEEFVTAWLWSQQAGVISHESALALHDLSDVLPSRIHLTVPAMWRERRFRVPSGVVLHYSDVSPRDRTWFGAVPTTNALRTLVDCAHDSLSPDLIRQAAQQAVRRGLVTPDDLASVATILEPFGGLVA